MNYVKIFSGTYVHLKGGNNDEKSIRYERGK